MKITKKLTNEEYNVLNKLATQSKMDCWFSIETTEKEPFEDFIRDLANEECFCLCYGISMFDEGLTDLDDYNLTEEEKHTYNMLEDKMFNENLELSKQAYKIYLTEFCDDHDIIDNTPVCYREFCDNEWQDYDYVKYCIKKIQGEN